jgi:Cys-rich protein (TIGR01571 family)
MAYASNLGREYVLPVQGVGRHGYQSEIKALCWLYCLLGCVFSCGIGQIFSLCGNAFINFAACYSCHGRYKIRKKYQLPPAFCLPPLLDDFLVHFFCLYCASYQEMRELAIRGIDGPGMHVLDLLPESFVGAAGAEEAVEERRDMVIQYMKRPLTFFNKEGTVVVPATADIKGGTTDVGAVGAGDMNVKAFPAAMFSATKMTAQAAAANILGRPSENAIDGTTADDGGGTEGGGGGVGGTEGGVQFHEFGWWRYCENSQGRAVIPPQQLEMDRRRVRVLEEDEDGSLRPPSRAWSVAY